MKSWFASHWEVDILARHWGKLLVLQTVLLVGLGYLLATMIAGGAARSPQANPAAVTAEPTLWTCAMHPQVRDTEPGQCPICRMDLTPVARWTGGTNASGTGSTSTGQTGASSHVPGHATVMIPGESQQRIGVRTGWIEKGPLRMSVEALGIVQPDETRIARVNIKTDGWVDKLFVNFVGQAVRKGNQFGNGGTGLQTTGRGTQMMTTIEPCIATGVTRNIGAA